MEITKEKRITIVCDGDLEFLALNHIAEAALLGYSDMQQLTESGKLALKMAEEIRSQTEK